MDRIFYTGKITKKQLNENLNRLFSEYWGNLNIKDKRDIINELAINE